MSATLTGSTCLPVAVWYLHSEDGAPIGQKYRRASEAVPSVGARVDDVAGWGTVVVVSFEELAATCAMRRYRVVVRVLG